MPDPRRSRSWGVVYAVLAGTFALAGVAAWAIYSRFVRYDAVAARHLPPGVDHGLRVHVEQKFIFAPVRAELLPLLDAIGQGPTPLADGRLERLRKRHGVEVTVDLREIVVGWSGAEASWVLVLGGKFGRGKVIPALDAALIAEGHPSTREGDTVRVGGLTVAQAADGAVVVGSTPALAAAAALGSGRAAELGLAGTEPLAAVALGPGGGAGGFRAVGRRQGETLVVEATFGLGPDDDPAFAGPRRQGLVASWATGAGLAWGDRVELVPRPGEAVLRVTLTEADLQAFLHLVAGRLRAEAGLPVTAPPAR